MYELFNKKHPNVASKAKYGFIANMSMKNMIIDLDILKYMYVVLVRSLPQRLKVCILTRMQSELMLLKISFMFAALRSFIKNRKKEKLFVLMTGD